MELTQLLGAYCHEWRAIPPPNWVVALYEAARIKAIEVNFCPGDEFLLELIKDLEKIAANECNLEDVESSFNKLQDYLITVGTPLEQEEMKSVLVDGNASRNESKILADFLFAKAYGEHFAHLIPGLMPGGAS